MRLPFSRRARVVLGFSLWIAVLLGAAYYLSTRKIEIHITSKLVGVVAIGVILLVFVILPVYSVIVTHEIRRRKRVEKALLLAKEEAERASKFKDRFLSTMSHELRTPLNAVLGFSDLLSDPRYGELNERQQRYVNHINTAGRHLLRLISDILDLSKIEAGRMEISSEDLAVTGIFGEVISALRPLAEKKTQLLETSVDRDVAVHADATRFKQILLNLAGNAIKFTPEGGRIELTAQKAGNTVQVSVQDNGPGIPKEEQRRIFDAFYRLRKSGENVEGTGLGLAITESLVKLQGGALGLESEPGRGSRFYFNLPAAAAVPETRASLAKPLPKKRAAAKILIIEDDRMTAHLIESQLASAGYEALSCTEPQRALEMAVEARPQAITLDLLMKPTSGWEILLQLKKDERTANIPVIVVTIVDHPSAGAALGAEEYLVKPVEKDALLAAVERCVARSKDPGAGSILVVEDDAPTRNVITEVLERQGYRVTVSEDGEAARTQVAAVLPQLVVLDLLLPKVSGLELLAEWRASQRTSKLPVLVLTSKELTAHEKHYLRDHSQSLFFKHQPWQEALLKQVERVVGASQAVET